MIATTFDSIEHLFIFHWNTFFLCKIQTVQSLYQEAHQHDFPSNMGLNRVVLFLYFSW